MDKDFGNKLAKVLTKVGVILTRSGADVHRVEDTMQRICKAYGASVIDAYVTPSLLIISFSFADQKELFHNIKRVYSSSYDLDKIDKINTLSREVCQKPIDLQLFDQRLDDIDRSKGYTRLIKIIAGAISSFSFAFIFKGDLVTAIVSFFVGTIVMIAGLLLEKIELSSFLKNILLGALLTFVSMILSSLIACERDVVIIATIMLLVPGLIITNAVRDTVNGDMISGITRFIEAIMIAIAVALGSGMILLLGGV